jgi:2-C-methyl-D-erythritol 2,4-cyclodiphosphate synthase
MRYKGADSMELLRCVAEKLKVAGYRVSNVDVTMIAQQPKLKPYIPQMMENIANALEIALDRVNVKATTEEHLGFTGTMEGMACHAVCLLEE